MAGDLVTQRCDVGVERLELCLDAARTLEDGAALVGRFSGGPVDQGQTQLAFEARDVGGDVGLHRVQGAGCTREGAVLSDGDERPELFAIHRWTRY